MRGYTRRGRGAANRRASNMYFYCTCKIKTLAGIMLALYSASINKIQASEGAFGVESTSRT